MIYVEFIERDRWVPIEVFRHSGNQQSNWSEGSVDRMLLQLGRTMRLGPRPSYLCLWDIPDIALPDYRPTVVDDTRCMEISERTFMQIKQNIDELVEKALSPLHEPQSLRERAEISASGNSSEGSGQPFFWL